MANGIDWFRWHHGSVNDEKFKLIARRSGASLPDVLAVWAYLLEKASASDVRGQFSDIDTEAVDCLFDFPSIETRTADILAAMEARGLISGNHISRWEDRQPKREREDNSAADRKRQQRAREAEDNTVTPSHTTSRQKTPREEKSREEKKEPKSKAKAPAAPTFDPAAELLALDVLPQTAADWLALRKTKRAAVTPTALKNIASEASKAGLSLEAALSLCCSRGWAGFEASWVLKDQQARASPRQAQQANTQTLLDRINGPRSHDTDPRIIDINEPPP